MSEVTKKTPAKKLLEKVGKKNEMAFMELELKKAIAKIFKEHTNEDQMLEEVKQKLLNAMNNKKTFRAARAGVEDVLNEAAGNKVMTRDTAKGIFRDLATWFSFFIKTPSAKSAFSATSSDCRPSRRRTARVGQRRADV